MKGYYKKQLCFFVGLASGILIFTGCQRDRAVTQREDVFEYSSGESDIKEPDKKSNDVLEEVAASVKDEKSYYEYHGNEVVIEYQYMAKGAASVGIMILCDGVATPYHTEENTENKLLQKVSLEDGKQKEIDLCFVPYGNEGDTVSVEIVDVVDPNYNVTEGDQEKIVADFIHGQKYNVSYLSGVQVAMKTDGITYSRDFFDQYSQEVIPDEVKKDDSTYDAANLKNLNAIGLVNEEQSLWYTLEQGEKLDLNIRYFGSAPGDILTSVYIDGELYPAFSGREYAECPVDDKKYTVVKGTIRASDLEKGRHTVFGVCGNVDYNNAKCLTSFVVEVK